MFSKLIPRKTDFFDLFSRHAELCVRGAQLLRDLLRDPTDALGRAAKIHDVEHQADAVRVETMESLHKTFITPIERGDVHRLSSQLDDIADHIEASAQRVALYEIVQATPEAIEMSENLVRATEALKATVDALGKRLDALQVRELCQRVKLVEKENDRVLRRATARLFKEEQDPRMLIKWNEIYGDLEGAVDRCEDVANVVEGVVIENS